MKDTSSTDSSTRYSSSQQKLLTTSSPTTNRKLVVMAKDNAPRETQLKKAKQLLEKPLKLGDKWYLLSKDWYVDWSAYIGLDESQTKLKETPPEKINNRKLFEIDHKTATVGSSAKKIKLREGLLENIDFVTVPKELWNYLVEIYSLESPDDVIEREVIDDSMDGLEGDPSNLKIEIWPLQVQMECAYNKSESTTAKHVVQEMSRQTKLDKIIERMKTLFNVPADKRVQLYFRPLNETSTDMMTEVEVKENSTLMTTSYTPNDAIVMRVLSPGDSTSEGVKSQGIPPAPTLPSSSCTTQIYPSTRYSTHMASRYQNNGISNERRGLCGLSNLGNTCFMNSALQCMSNVPLLTDYFLTQKYKSEINTVNPLGRHGEIAEAYANLISEIWSGNNSYVIPRQFKFAISKFAPQFTGYQQQDSQELLAFLLDGLHEDLNRVLQKPYVELGSHVGKTDEVFAEESWNDHKKRNDSIIVDIFHGLLKSTLNCLVCHEISIKFDPFCYLSVPLPSKRERLIEVIFVPLDPNQLLLKCKLAVVKNGTIQDLCTSMEKLLETDPSIRNKVPRTRMVVCDVYSNKFFKIFEPTDSIHPIKERDDIYIYELESNYNNSEYFKIKLHMREKTSSHSTSMSCFGLPIFLTVPKEGLTYGVLYKYSLKHLSRFLKIAGSNEDINLDLNKSLNVKDEPVASIDQDVDGTNGDNSNNDSDDDTENRSKSTKQSAKVSAKKPFTLNVSKSDNVDFDSGSNIGEISDDTPFEWPTNTSYSYGSSQIVSLCADFTPALLKRFYKGPRSSDSASHSELVEEHSSCQTTQLIKQRKEVFTLNECFTLYTKMEELSGQDYWYCSKCKTHQASTKKFDLWKLPPVLVVHLKRFSYDRMFRDKIDTLVDFPLTDLDMAPYLINKKTDETKYNLIAVSNHYGSLGGGHYTAYGKNRCDGKWYYFDDSSVSPSDESHVCTPAAYMLIYLRKDLQDAKIGTGSMNEMEEEIGQIRSNSEKMDH